MKCKYSYDDKLQYAMMQLGEHMILIDVNEVSLFNEYLEKARNKDSDIEIDTMTVDDEPMQIIYGALMFNSEQYQYDEITTYVNDMKYCVLYDLAKDNVNVSGYLDLVLFKDKAASNNFIPFAALMKTPHRLINRVTSITMFPAISECCVWESMVNRPFLLACRESLLIKDISENNWKKFIDENRMMKSYKIADLVCD